MKKPVDQTQQKPKAKFMPLVKKSRMDELLSIGLVRLVEMETILNVSADILREKIRLIGIIPFEKWWYNEYQVDLIVNFETVKREL